MKSQIRSILFVAAALFLGQSALHANIFTYNNGDVLLVFRQPGQPNLEVNLGPVSQFINASPGSQTTISNFSSAQLQAAYSSVAALNWAAISTIRGASVYSLPVNTLFLTNPRTNATTQTTPYNEQSTFQQASVGSLIATIAGFGSTEGAVVWSSGTPANAISNTPNVVIIPESDSSSYTSIAGDAGDLGGNFNQGDIENLTPSPFTSGSTRSDLYELEPGSSPGTYLGYFEFDPDGTVSFTAAGGASASSDIAVSKVASPTSVTVGSNVTYTLSVQNNGPAAATNVVLTDALPAGVSYVSALANQGTTAQAGGVVTWSVGNLANSAGASATIVVSTVSTGLISNTASVTYAGAASNSTASATITVNAVILTNEVPNLAVAKVADAASYTLGSNITYTVTVLNNGPAAATNVVLTDALPAGVSYVSALANQGTTAQAGGVVTWNVGNLANSAGASATIVVSTVSTGLISNTASVTYAGAASNSTASASVTVTNISPVIEFPDLSIVKVTGPKAITLTAKKPSVTKSATVEIANVGTNIYTITSLSNLVTLAVESLTTGVPNAEVALVSGRPQKPLPVTLKKKEKLSVVFDVTFNETTNSEFRYVAELNDTVVSNALVNVIVKPAKQ
ncbi:MAG: DUF11 domain-containing protein [Verrucomicrobiia bacterium]